MQETWVQSLSQEDPTCLGATKPVHHNLWNLLSGACALQQGKPLQKVAHAPQLEKACAEQWRLSAAINKQTKFRKNLMVLWNSTHVTFPGSIPITFPITPVQPSSSPNCSFTLVLPQGCCTYCLHSLKFLPPATCLVPSGHISHCLNVPLSETASLINLSKVESLPQHLHPFPVSFYRSSLISTWNTFSFLAAQMVKTLPATQETQVQSLGWEGPLEKGMDTHSNILAWRIPWAEKPGGLQSIVSQGVRYNWETNIFILFIHFLFIYLLSVLSHSIMPNSLWRYKCSLPSLSVHGDPPGKNTAVDCHALLQGIFPTQGSNPGLPHCRQILYLSPIMVSGPWEKTLGVLILW